MRINCIAVPSKRGAIYDAGAFGAVFFENKYGFEPTTARRALQVIVGSQNTICACSGDSMAGTVFNAS